jgi:hypothetical protein
MHLERLLVPAGLVLFALAAIVSPASAKQSECKAINQSQDVAYNPNNNENPLGAAISAAASGDTIKVLGTCHGSFSIQKDLTINGRPSDRHDDAIIGAEGSAVLRNIAHLTLRDLTITGGGAAGIDSDGDVSLIRTNVTRNAGGGIVNGNGSVTLEDSAVSDNAGIGIFNRRGQVTMSNSRVTDGSGVGISAPHGTVLISDSVIAGNDGGGIASAGFVRLFESLIEGNTSEGVGGGVASFDVGRVDIISSTIRGNTASQGGGIYNAFMTFGEVTITDSVITGNRATGGAGGIPGNGGGIYNGERVSLIRSSVTANTASAAGGGIFNGGSIFNSERLSLTDSSVTGNTASTAGGGIFNSGFVTLNGTNVLCPNSPDDWPSCSP